MKSLISVITMLMLFFTAQSQSKDIQKQILGKWVQKSAKAELSVKNKDYSHLVKYVEETIGEANDENENEFEFFADKKIVINGEEKECTYSINENILTLKDENTSIDFTVKIEKDILMLSVDKEQLLRLIAEDMNTLDIDGVPLSTIINEPYVKVMLSIVFSRMKE